MTTSELLDQLRAEGIKNAKPHIVGHAVNRSDGQARVAQPSFSCSCS